MKQFPIPSGPPSDDRDRPGVPSPKAVEPDDTDGDRDVKSYDVGGLVPKPGGNSVVQKPTLNQGFAKGGNVASASYAAGGPVLGRARDFIKEEPDQFRGNKKSSTPGAAMGPQVTHDDKQSYPKKGATDGPCKTKTMTPVMPRK